MSKLGPIWILLVVLHYILGPIDEIDIAIIIIYSSPPTKGFCIGLPLAQFGLDVKVFGMILPLSIEDTSRFEDILYH